MEQETKKACCLQCQRLFRGNDNKKFCGDRCRNAYHNLRRQNEAREIGLIILRLKENRRIICELLNGRSTGKVSKDVLLEKGFLFFYFTNTYTRKEDRKRYTFCFDYGYLREPEGSYTIVQKGFVIGSPERELQAQ